MTQGRTDGEAHPTESERAWYPDVLGEGWSARDLNLPRGAVATLVRRDPGPGVDDPSATASSGPARPAVLYVHGFVDYFFQRHVADAFAARGYPFYALDLRGYGRSIGRGSGAPVRPDDDPNFVTDLAVYTQDLDAARAAIQAEGHMDLVVIGHSMGGLVTSLWAHARPGALTALVLNSPWFDLNANWFDRVVATRAVDVLGPLMPRAKVGALHPSYGQALHTSTGGQWEYELAWKPIAGFPVRAGWLRTIRRSHRRLARGLAIDCPVLVLASDATGPHDRWHPDLLSTDSVLDVEQIRRRADGLGPDVTQVTIAGGAHDLALSAGTAGEEYLQEALDWLEAVTATSDSR